MLSACGVIDLVETRQSRGSTEHFHRANELGRKAIAEAESEGLGD